MNTRRQFIATVAGAAAVSSKSSGADERELDGDDVHPTLIEMRES
jgi:hypothetical protein